MSNFQSVKLFMKTFGQKVNDKPNFPDKNIVELRYSLIKEELEEFYQAIQDKNLKEIADSLTDILYVTYGAGHAFGIDLDKCFDDGKPIYNEYGKVMKGPKYFKPDLSKFTWIIKPRNLLLY